MSLTFYTPFLGRIRSLCRYPFLRVNPAVVQSSQTGWHFFRHRSPGVTSWSKKLVSYRITFSHLILSSVSTGQSISRHFNSIFGTADKRTRRIIPGPDSRDSGAIQNTQYVLTVSSSSVEKPVSNPPTEACAEGFSVFNFLIVLLDIPPARTRLRSVDTESSYCLLNPKARSLSD